MTAPFLRFEHVHRAYGPGATALEDVDLEVGKGEIVFLTGPSGAGKTTVLKMLWAEERPDRGDVLIEGRSLRRLAPDSVPFLRRNIGIVFQDFRLLARRTVADNVALALEVLGTPTGQIRPRVLEMLARVGLTGLGSRLPGHISAGEQQRVAVARALVHRPTLVLADEPTGNLDHELRDILMDLLVELARAEGATVLIATHDRELVQTRGFREIRLHGGRIVEDRPERRGSVPFPVDWTRPAMPPSLAPPRPSPAEALPDENTIRERARAAREAASALLARSPIAAEAGPPPSEHTEAPLPATPPPVPQGPTTDEIIHGRIPIVFAVAPVPAEDDSIRRAAPAEPMAPPASPIREPDTARTVADPGIETDRAGGGPAPEEPGSASVRKKRRARTDRTPADPEPKEKPTKRAAGGRGRAPRT